MNHIRTQPLYQTLKQYRILAICSVMFIGWLMVDLLDWCKTTAETLSAEASAGLFAFLAALLGAFVKALNNVREKHEE
jgi:hypothetical protein